MSGRWTGALAAGCVLAVAAAAAVDAVRRSPEQPPAEAVEAPQGPPECGDDQLALEVRARGDAPVAVLRHRGGPACRAPEVEVAARVAPASGEARGVVHVLGGWTACGEGCRLDTIGGLFAPGVEAERMFHYQPRCDEQGPFEVVVTAGPHSARAPLPVLACRRTEAEADALYRECLRRWNGPANRANRARVAGRFDEALVFLWSHGEMGDGCGVRFVDSRSGRWLVAGRSLTGQPEIWSPREGERWPGDRPAGDFADSRELGVGPGGRLSLEPAPAP